MTRNARAVTGRHVRSDVEVDSRTDPLPGMPVVHSARTIGLAVRAEIDAGWCRCGERTCPGI